MNEKPRELKVCYGNDPNDWPTVAIVDADSVLVAVIAQSIADYAARPVAIYRNRKFVQQVDPKGMKLVQSAARAGFLRS